MPIRLVVEPFDTLGDPVENSEQHREMMVVKR